MKLLGEQCSQFAWEEPGSAAVEHAVTIGADQDQVLGLGLVTGHKLGKRTNVVCLDEAFAYRAIERSKVEATHTAAKCSVLGKGISFDERNETRVSFARSVEALHNSTFWEFCAGFGLGFVKFVGSRAAFDKGEYIPQEARDVEV